MKIYRFESVGEDENYEGDWCSDDVRLLEKENKDLLQNWLEEREQHQELQIRYEILLQKYKELKKC